MRVEGEWLACDDGVIRPVIRGQILDGSGCWLDAPFLVDTGADRTVISAVDLRRIGLESSTVDRRLAGLGGLVRSVEVTTRIRFVSSPEGLVVLRGTFAALTELEALDMSVLGRDVTGEFVLIVDRPANIVCMLASPHAYRVEGPPTETPAG